MRIMEIWKAIEGYEKKYEVSNAGNVRSIKSSGKHLCSFDSGKGYRMVGLSDCGKVKKFLVHRLVASAFVPGEIKGLQVNHINGVRNDNRSDNLEWVTASENLKHSYKNLGRKAQSNRGRCTGKENHWSKPVISTGEDGSERRFESGMQAAKELGLKKSSISSCCQGKANQTGGYKFRFA